MRTPDKSIPIPIPTPTPIVGFSIYFHSYPTGVSACAEKLSLLSWRFENRFFEMPDVVVSPAEAGRLSLS
jgi:hypothetical protein